MSVFTSKATGNWSASGQTTWNEVGVPGSGDTASIGAHTVTVNVNTTVGTSPNDATTIVLNLTVASSKIIVAAGVTFTVQGNRGAVNSSTFQQNAGSTVTFDNSGSGGSPVYTDVNVGLTKYIFNGSLGNIATIQAIAGQTFKPNASWSLFTATYMTMRRASNLQIAQISGNVNISDSVFDTCAYFDPTSNASTVDFILDRVEFVSGTDATNDMTLNFSAVLTSGTRRIYRCKLDKLFTYSAKTFIIDENYLGGGFHALASKTVARAPRNNFIQQDGTVNAGNGMGFPFSLDRTYVVVSSPTRDNPHYLAPSALQGADNNMSQLIFEAQEKDDVDTGDCLLMYGAITSGGNKIFGKNCIVLPSAYPGTTDTSGTFLTLYTSTVVGFEMYHNTCNVNPAFSGGRGAFDVAEAGNGVANQVTAIKSNIAWASSPGGGYMGQRMQGNVKDIITPAGADYNWRFNTSAGDNQIGYEDYAASNTLWTAGDAVAAGVDVHGGTGDPQFLDPTRNVAVWCAARGYGAATYAAGIAALRADPSRATDLINYVFEGFKVRNTSCRTAAHDGGVVGAANFHKASRSLANITAFRSYASTKYGIAV